MQNRTTPLPLYKHARKLDVPEPSLPNGQAPARKVYIETYGCQMNVSDSELIAGILTQAGHRTVPDIADADVVLLNTCAIRENAETKVLNRLTHLNHRKRRDRNLIIGVCGCMAQHLAGPAFDSSPIRGPRHGARCVPESADGTERCCKWRPVSQPTVGQK